MLNLKNVQSGYGPVTIIWDVSLKVGKGEIVSMIGANGAGKTTLLKTISGVVGCTGGSIIFEGEEIQKKAPHEVVDRGIIQVPEGRQIINEFTVKENLLMGCYRRHKELGQKGREKLLAYACELFPILEERLDQLAGTLSGGQQQMVAISRALMGQPKIMLTDEPSLGLAPMIVQQVCDVLVELNKNKGLTVLLVEQNAMVALEMANRAYVLEGGRTILEGSGTELLNNDKVREGYLGV
ncbi:MAG: ABC transporter ATP-binding protein [Desulfuromonadaceae bacterium]